MSQPTYLDYAAATPMDHRVVEAMGPYFSQRFYNPSATYLAGKAAKTALNKARADIAKHLGARPSEIVFTAGATEANNLAIKGIMSSFPEGEVLVSAIEHDSVLAPAARFDAKLIPVTPQGIVDVTALKKMITPTTVLISVMMVNNELGTIQPLKEIAAVIKEIRHQRSQSKNSLPLYLHTDAAQAGNLFDLHVARLGIDLMSLNGGKIYGPKQSGVLFVKAGTKLLSLIEGGGQEMNLRSGTENVAGAVGLAAALDIAQKNRKSEVKRLTDLRNLFIKELAQALPGATINGSPKHQSPHLLHVAFPGQDNERLMFQLDEAGVQAAVGSACSAADTTPSHVLTAIGLSDEQARSSLRFSFGRPTTEKDIRQTVALLKQFASD